MQCAQIAASHRQVDREQCLCKPVLHDIAASILQVSERTYIGKVSIGTMMTVS